MPPKAETKLVAKMKARLDEMIQAGAPLWYFKVHGGPHQLAGVPDLCIVYHGFSFWVEAKTPDGKVSPLQMYRMSEITKAGGYCAVAVSVSDLERILDEGLCTLQKRTRCG